MTYIRLTDLLYHYGNYLNLTFNKYLDMCNAIGTLKQIKNKHVRYMSIYRYYQIVIPIMHSFILIYNNHLSMSHYLHLASFVCIWNITYFDYSICKKCWCNWCWAHSPGQLSIRLCNICRRWLYTGYSYDQCINRLLRSHCHSLQYQSRDVVARFVYLKLNFLNGYNKKL